MSVFDLAKLDWRLTGWRPNAWLLFKSAETGQTLQADVGPVPARVPGSVQQALLDAGIVKDWNVGLNSRDAEWIEHRHWHYSATIPAGAIPKGERVILDAQGFDYAGWIYIDGKEAGKFEGTLIPHRFDLTPHLSEEDTHRLDIFFDEPPREQGQLGFTSRSYYLKPRFNYSWDWTPRIVTIGIWEALTLQTGLDATLSVLDLRSDLAEDNRTGSVGFTIKVDPRGDTSKVARYEATVSDGDRVLGTVQGDAAGDDVQLVIDGLNVEPWWPNGMAPDGARPKTYGIRIQALSKDGKALWSCEKSVGFKRVEWKPCKGAPADALPWICVVNGKPVFLQGVNWSPVRTGFADTTAEEYERLVELYREMGCNVLRVWGGGLLERTVFLDACDRAGLLVWQDFPLSSSGVDNIPPCDAGVISRLVQTVTSYIRRHGHHACRLMWCGGNELTDANTIPITCDHPCIAPLRDAVERFDPGRRFIPTTACGPLFYALPENFGKGLHHLVHGPWGMGQQGSMEAWKEYWANDDALFRAEVGMPGAESAELIKRYAGDMPVWPPTGDYWRHSVSWWIDWERHKVACCAPDEDEALRQYVERTQAEQAEALTIAVKACKDRFPKCGGIILWHGHDCFPCPINNSLIDFDQKPKPVFHALQAVFRAEPGKKA